MFRLPTETVVTRLKYLDGGMRLTLSRPNIVIVLPGDDAHDPRKVATHVRNTWGGRHVLSGRAFEDSTVGLCRRRWEELVSVAPIEDENDELTEIKQWRS